MKNTMTIHQGLAELKLIDNKITKLTRNLEPVGSHRKDCKIDGIIEIAEFTKNTKADFQSVTDLIARKFKIKAAIVKANAETMVEVGGKKMSIADSITYRDIIKAKAHLANQLAVKYNGAYSAIETANKAVDDKAFALAEQAVGSENANKNQKDAQAIIGPYVEANKLHLVDPLKVVDVIGNLNEEVDNFETEIDAALSVANATTSITIE